MSITSVVSLAAGKIGELLLEEAKFLYGVEDEVRSLQDELIMMQNFLFDMEAMDEEEGDERSRTTIKQIRKVAYDAEDLIESHILEASNSPPEGIFGRYSCCCTSLPRTHQIGSEIIAIKARIGETMERWNKYLGENGIGRITYARQDLNKRNRLGIRPIAYSHTIEDHVFGLDEDINKLIGVLTSDDKDTKSIEVVSFVGMGGSGKTTLARKLYNHETIKRHFDCVAWMSISQQWVVKQILLDLLKKVGGESTRDDDFSSHELVEKLHCCLDRKRFLIVLDDVWTKQALEEILPAFPLRTDGKKLIVTTRNQNVAGFPDVKSFIHEPRRLTGEESWELFRKIALIHRGSSSSSILDEIPVLEALGKEMLKKCQGLPLAVIALAGILGKKETIEEWEKMKKTVSSRIMEDGCGTHLYGPVNKMLMLSYYDLPRELKPCFLYLAMFPEDYEIPTGQLIRMWIAEGFIKPNEEDTVEDVARSYLDELIHRCVVQIARKNYHGKVIRIRVHDLVRDLCIKKTNEEDFLHIFTTNSTNSDSIVTESRRVAVYSSDRVTLPFPTNCQHLRSLVYVAVLHLGPPLPDIQKDFRLLRVLRIQGITVSDGILPAAIGRLIHLRYLHLLNTNITELPSSIGNLRKLSTLQYGGAPFQSFHDFTIPDVIWKMEGLRHLYLPVTGRMKQPLNKFHTLKHLQTLSNVQGGDWMLKELPRLSQSVRKLIIRAITSEKQLQIALECPSIKFDRLHSLELQWSITSAVYRRYIKFNTENQKQPELTVKQEVLESILHCQRLRKLNLTGRMAGGGGIQLPASINSLDLSETRFEEEAMLVALGKLPYLTYLSLSCDSYMGNRWTCSDGQFLRLKQLYVFGLPKLEEWRIERGAMPQLITLRISGCEELRRIPEGLKFITSLQELELSAREFGERVKGEDAHIIQHVPLVTFI